MKKVLTVLLATLLMLGCASCLNRAADRYPVDYGLNNDVYDGGYYTPDNLDNFGNVQPAPRTISNVDFLR